MAWTQTLALWKPNATPPCSRPLMWHAVHWQLCFFPLCVGKSFLDIFTEKVSHSGADGDAPFQITERSGTPKMIQAGCFLENRWFVEPSQIVTLVSYPPTRHIKTRSRGTNMLPWPYPHLSAPPALCRAPFRRRSGDWRHQDTACGDQVRRLPSFAILRRKGTAVSAALSPPFVCTHGFYFDKQHSGRPLSRGSEAPNLFAFCVDLCRAI